GYVNVGVHRLTGAQPAILVVYLDAYRRAARVRVDARADARHSVFDRDVFDRERAELDAVSDLNLVQILLEDLQLDPQMVEVRDLESDHVAFDSLIRRDIPLD